MKLHMPPDAWESVGHGHQKFVISNSSRDFGECEIEVPDEVGHVLLRCSAGAVRIDLPEPERCMELVRVKHQSGKSGNIGWDNKVWTPDADGFLWMPLCSLPDIMPHGYVQAPEKKD